MYFRQPEYVSGFKCIGGSCQFTCCRGWTIDWSQEEIDKVKNAPDCSEELRVIMDKFVPSKTNKDLLMVSLNEQRKCPMLTENGLCRIQKELGEEYLSEVCRTYPRVYRLSYNSKTKANDFIYRYCNMSCPEIAKRLVLDKNAMRLVNVSGKNQTVRVNSEEDYEKYPEKIYSTDILEFFYDLISDKRYSVETALINGAIAAQILDEVVAEKNYDFIPQALKELHDGFIKGGLFNDVENIKPDYIMKFGFVLKLINFAARTNVTSLLKTPEGKLDLKLYKTGEANLNVIFDNDDYWLRNIALNLLLELKIPFYSDDSGIFETYRLFVTVFACIKLNAIASVSKGDVKIRLNEANGFGAIMNAKDGIWGFASIISRNLCQNKSVGEGLNQILKAEKFNTPADLAMLIK